MSKSPEKSRRQAPLAWLPLALLLVIAVFFGVIYLLDALSLPRWGQALIQAAVAGAAAYLLSKFWRRSRS